VFDADAPLFPSPIKVCIMSPEENKKSFCQLSGRVYNTLFTSKQDSVQFFVWRGLIIPATEEQLSPKHVVQQQLFDTLKPFKS